MTDPRTTGVSLRTLALTVGALLVLFALWSYRDSIGDMFRRPAPVVSEPVAPVVNVPAPVVHVEPVVKVQMPPAILFKADEDYDFYLGEKRLDGAVIYTSGWCRWSEGPSEGRLMYAPVDLRWKRRTLVSGND